VLNLDIFALLIPFIFIASYFPNYPSLKEVFVGIKTLLSGKYIFIAFIGRIIGLLGYNCFRLLTNQHFTPCHRNMADVFYIFSEWIYYLSGLNPSHESTKDSLNIKYIVGMVGGYCGIFFAASIYLELIVIKVWGFDKNTKKYISNKEVDEFGEFLQQNKFTKGIIVLKKEDTLKNSLLEGINQTESYEVSSLFPINSL
jgi:hypothetical protein